MKTLLGLLLAVLVSVQAFGQPGSGASYYKPYMILSATARASEADTTNVFQVGGAKIASLKFLFTDRFNVDSVTFEYRPKNDTTWSRVTQGYKFSTINSTTNATNYYYEKVFRDGYINYAPVIEGSMRCILNFKTSLNDTSAYYVYLVRSQ
jgi:hypothetical protein